MRTASFRWIVLAASLVMLSGGYAVRAMAQTAPLPPAPGPVVRERTIVVTGDGAVDVVPDRATIAVSATAQRPTAQEAQQQSAAAMSEVVRQVLALGLPPTSIRTSSVSLVPQRRPQPNGPGPIIGYQATNRAVVTVDDITRVGRVIDTAVSAGANGVDGLTWDLRDATSSRSQAFRLAVQSAAATANAIAGAAGISGLRLIQVEQIGAIVTPRQGLAMSEAAPATPVLAGTIPVRVQVRAVYAF